MTNHHLAKGYREEAEQIFDGARGHHQKGEWHLVVRRAQEVVELSLKSLLRHEGIEVPHFHDVGGVLKENRALFPGLDVDRLASISRKRFKERETSFYGEEETGLLPQEIYSEIDADEALEEAGYVLETVSKVLQTC